MSPSDNKLKMLQQTHQLTQTMLNLAKQEKWEAIEPLNQQRQVLLQAIFPIADSLDEMETISSVLRSLIDTNQELIAHCQEGKQSLQLQMRQAKFTQKAVTAYHSN